MRIFTCTPVAFGGGPDFFERDSGLLCRGLQSIGIPSRAVMPGERMPGDEDDLIRTEYHNLESAEWWESHGLDGVVLYAWGRPKFRKVAKAIHDAGIFLVLNQDNGGLVSPVAGPVDWLAEQGNLSGLRLDCHGWIRWARLVLRGITIGLAVTDPLRACHLKQGDVIACVSPKAERYYRKWCRLYGGAGLAGRLTVLPHAVEPSFRWSGQQKKPQVISVGRWDDEIQKRPQFLSAVVSQLLEREPSVEVVITGSSGRHLEAWHGSLNPSERRRVRLVGKVGRGALHQLMDESQVFYSPSAYESFGIAAAESLCCGCSLVAAKSVSMASFEWFVSEKSGTLACIDRPEHHVESLLAELAAWDCGARNPESISRIWCSRLHADKVAGQVVRLREAGFMPVKRSSKIREGV